MATFGATVLMAGVVMLVLGGAGLLSSGGASYSRMRTAKPIVFIGQLVGGVLAVGIGLGLLLS